MEYPTNLSVSAVAVNICDGIFSPFYDITWSIKYKITNWSPSDDYGLCFFLRDGSIPLSGGSGGGRGIDLGYSGTRNVDILTPDAEVNGLEGGVIGIGLDTHGAFAAKTVWPGGVSRSGLDDVEPNSITLRGGSDNNYEFLNVHYPVSAFNLLSDGVKILRARLGNFGRTIFLDYRDEGDTDFVNILKEDVDLNLQSGMRLTPGVSFAKPLFSTQANFNIVVDTFHIEGKEGEPSVTVEYPEPLLPIDCNSIYGGEVIQSKPDIEFKIPSPVDDIVNCEDVTPSIIDLVVDSSANGTTPVKDDIIVYTLSVSNNSSRDALNVILNNSINEDKRVSVEGATSLFTSGSTLSAGSTYTVKISYIVDGSEGDKHITTTTATSLNADSKTVVTEVPLAVDTYKFRINTNYGADKVFKLPLLASGSYNFNINWGDGIVSDVTSYNDPVTVHEYKVDGIYDVTINGNLSGWQFTQDEYLSRLQYIETINWTGLNITTNAAFSGCENYLGDVIAIGVPKIRTSDMSYCFAQCYNFNGDVKNWDVNGLTSIEGMFSEAYKFNQPLGRWNIGGNLTTAANILSGGEDSYSFSIANYTDMLDSWYKIATETNNFPQNVQIDVDQLKSSRTSFNQLTAEYGWNINDLGVQP